MLITFLNLSHAHLSAERQGTKLLYSLLYVYVYIYLKATAITFERISKISKTVPGFKKKHEAGHRLKTLFCQRTAIVVAEFEGKHMGQIWPKLVRRGFLQFLEGGLFTFLFRMRKKVRV